jgi:ABC-type dipeptide/oligopeptide/nickel transport system ATPase subunit
LIMPLIKFENVDFSYLPKERILNKISFSLEKGHCLAIVGESGSGKSTLGKLIIGELKTKQGSIEYQNKPLNKCRQDKRLSYTKNVQMVFQDSTETFNPQIRIKDILAEPFIIHRLPFDDQILSALLKEVFLPSYFLTCYPHQLSGGQKQRLSIARALSLKPSLLILDEPTSSLDIITKMQVLSLLKSIKNKFNATYILITHELNIARVMADKVIVLKKGEIVESGDMREIFANPQHNYSKKLLSSISNL